MPNAQLSIVKVVDGSRLVVLQVYIKGDNSGELVNEVLADPASLYPKMASKPCFSILEIDYDFSGFDVQLAYDSTPDQPIWNLPMASSSNHEDFRHMGGLADRSGLDGTGKLLISTKGLSVNKHGSFTITMKKRSQ